MYSNVKRASQRRQRLEGVPLMIGDQNKSSSLEREINSFKQDFSYKGRNRVADEFNGVAARSLNVTRQPSPTERISRKPNMISMKENIVYQNMNHNKGFSQTHHRGRAHHTSSALQKQRKGTVVDDWGSDEIPSPTERISSKPNMYAMKQNTVHQNMDYNKGLPQTLHRGGRAQHTSPALQKQIRENQRRFGQSSAPTTVMVNISAFPSRQKSNELNNVRNQTAPPATSQLQFLKEVDSTMCWFDTRNEIEQRSKNFSVNLMHALNKIGSDNERLRPDERVSNFSMENSPATSLPDIDNNQHHPSLVSLQYHLVTSSKRAQPNQADHKGDVSMDMSRVGSDDYSNVSSINNFISAKSYCPTVDKNSAKTRFFLRASTSWPAFHNNMNWSNLPLGLLKMDVLDPYGRLSSHEPLNPPDHLFRSVNLKSEGPWSSTDVVRSLADDEDEYVFADARRKKLGTFQLLNDFKIHKRIDKILPLQNFHNQPTKDKKRVMSAVFKTKSSQLDVDTIVQKVKARKIADAFFTPETGQNENYISFFDEGTIKKDKLDFTDEDMAQDAPVFHLPADERCYSPDLFTMLKQAPEVPKGKPAKELSDSIIRTVAALKKQMSKEATETSATKTDGDSRKSRHTKSTKTGRSYDENRSEIEEALETSATKTDGDSRKSRHTRSTKTGRSYDENRSEIEEAEETSATKTDGDSRKSRHTRSTKTGISYDESAEKKNSLNTTEIQTSDRKRKKRNSVQHNSSEKLKNSIKKGRKNSIGKDEKGSVIVPFRVKPPRREIPANALDFQPSSLGFDKSVNNFINVQSFDLKVASTKHTLQRSQIQLVPPKVIPRLPKEPEPEVEQQLNVHPKRRAKKTGKERRPSIKVVKTAPLIVEPPIDMDYLTWQHNFLTEIRAPLNLTTNEFTFSYLNLYNPSQTLENPNKEVTMKKTGPNRWEPIRKQDLLPELDETLNNFSGIMLQEDSRYRSHKKRIHNNELLKFLYKL